MRPVFAILHLAILSLNVFEQMPVIASSSCLLHESSMQAILCSRIETRASSDSAHSFAAKTACLYAAEIPITSSSLNGSFMGFAQGDLCPVGIGVFKVQQGSLCTSNPVAQAANGREIAIPSDKKSVGRSFHTMYSIACW